MSITVEEFNKKITELNNHLELLSEKQPTLFLPAVAYEFGKVMALDVDGLTKEDVLHKVSDSITDMLIISRPTYDPAYYQSMHSIAEDLVTQNTDNSSIISKRVVDAVTGDAAELMHHSFRCLTNAISDSLNVRSIESTAVDNALAKIRYSGFERETFTDNVLGLAKVIKDSLSDYRVALAKEINCLLYDINSGTFIKINGLSIDKSQVLTDLQDVKPHQFVTDLIEFFEVDVLKRYPSLILKNECGILTVRVGGKLLFDAKLTDDEVVVAVYCNDNNTVRSHLRYTDNKPLHLATYVNLNLVTIPEAETNV